MKTIIFSYNTLSIYDMFVYIYLTKLKNDEHKKTFEMDDGSEKKK